MSMERSSEIRIKDLVTHFGCRWKSILVVTVFCAMVLGGWQFISVKKVHDAGEQTKEEARYADELAAYRMNLENAEKDVDSNISTVESRRAYREQSLLMNLDPENVWVAEQKYLLSDAEVSAADILTAYTGAMTTDHKETAILEAFGTANAGYARELVSIIADSSENSFTVTVWAADKEKAEKGLAYVSGKIREAEKIAQSVGKHTLQTLNQGVYQSIFPDLITRQNALGEQIIEDENTLTRGRRILNNVKESEPFKPDDPVVRWAVTGAVLGLVAMLGIYLTTFLRKIER